MTRLAAPLAPVTRLAAVRCLPGMAAALIECLNVQDEGVALCLPIGRAMNAAEVKRPMSAPVVIVVRHAVSCLACGDLGG